MLGVQWHPEADPASAVIGALVDAAAAAGGGEDRLGVRVADPEGPAPAPGARGPA